MKNRIFISFLIAAALNFFCGCSITRSERVVPETFSEEKEVISSAVLINMDIIEFDRQGGRYRSASDVLAGKLVDGTPIVVPVKSIKQVRTSIVPPVSLDELDKIKISEILLKNNVLVIYNSDGGVYNKKSNKIIGKTDDNSMTAFRLDLIQEVHTGKPETISIKEAILNPEKVKQVVTYKGNFVEFDSTGAVVSYSQGMVTGVTKNGELVHLHPENILYLNVERTDVTGSILATVGVVAVIGVTAVAIVAILKESCPFVYSYDGERYIFDAEPLGGATSKGLERTEFSELKFLKNSSSGLKLLVRNEVEETQYLDELSLLVINHDSDKIVIPDLDGNFYQVKNPITPYKAFDEKGNDLTRIVSSDDNFYWQTKLPLDTMDLMSVQRHELIFTFNKSTGFEKAKLIANVGTSLWGSRMIREMLQLYGYYIDYYYDKIDQRGTDYEKMIEFIEREELYRLKYYVKKGEDWAFMGYMNGGGPLISETRLYNLDLSGVEGDSVTIKINPPYGFWTVGYMGIEYEDYPSPQIEILRPLTAVNSDSSDLKELLDSKDNKYVVMPEVGDCFEISFTSAMPDTFTSYYLKSTGYYEIHLDKTSTPDLELLSRLTNNQGYIINYSNQTYLDWEKRFKQEEKKNEY